MGERINCPECGNPMYYWDDTHEYISCYSCGYSEGEEPFSKPLHERIKESNKRKTPIRKFNG